MSRYNGRIRVIQVLWVPHTSGPIAIAPTTNRQSIHSSTNSVPKSWVIARQGL
jgi:hypothetical protein